MEAYQRLAERSPYMRCLLKAVVPNIDELMKTRGEASSGPTSSGGPNVGSCNTVHRFIHGVATSGVRSGYKRTVNQIVESDMPEDRG